jgi:quinone-modifying oxidoreductase subunit QmoB
MTTLKQALYVCEKYPDSKIYIIYKDMRTPAQYELFYKYVQDKNNIFFTKGELTGLEDAGSDSIYVDIDETLLGEKIRIKADMVVLATGMVPTTAISENGNTSDSNNENTSTAEIPISGNRMINSNILNLTYRQGPELPLLKYGFPDSHYICFPYETRRTGIYAAGAVRQPMDILSCQSDALGASLKAIQVIESIRRGAAVHPRAGDTSFPDFFLQRCTQCKRCTEECPFGTLDEDTKGTPKPNPNRCRRCGICMGACPERIISFKNYSVRMISDMIKSIYIPTEEEDDEATPRILAFMCENDAYPSFDLIAQKKVKITPYIRIIPVRCLGSTNISWIADALSTGFDGVILFGCKYGDDYQCHFIRGSELANRRMENVQEKLKQLVLEPERVELHMLSIDEYDKLPDIMNNFAKTIEDIGPNPYKGM